MIRIRSMHGTVLGRDRDRVEQVQAIFRRSFPEDADYAGKIPDLLDHPFRHGFRAVLLVAETSQGKVKGFALLLLFPEINSALLDFVAAEQEGRGSGLGSALYEAAREYCRHVGSRGLYMEVLSDEAALNRDPKALDANRRRMAFYERFGVRPIIGTDYEEPVGESAEAPPSLLFDGLGRTDPLRRAEARAAVRLILHRKYADLVGPDYIERVVESFVDDPVRVRPPRYVRGAERPHEVSVGVLEKSFAVISSPRHEVHHVQDRGYVERPARVGALQEAIAATGLFSEVSPRHFGEEGLLAIHDRDFVSYLRRVCANLSGRPVYPYVFPIRRPERRPRELALRAGYYCIDTFTPLDRNAYTAARAAADVAMTAAAETLAGRPVAYALCRPPGHHAGRKTFGGFCYFNNAAIAAQRLSREGKVALLDIDFHHGNGTQEIFYERADVLTISLHGHPRYAYPYFSGFADETGQGAGLGANRNFPLPENTGPTPYLEAFEKAHRLIERFAPDFVVVSLGLDTLRGDVTGAFTLTPSTMKTLGRRLAEFSRPLLIVQEGGYSLRNLKRGAAGFFNGVAAGSAPIAAHHPRPTRRATGS
jgi:acetoin utilization deacetylase AcuC-like enzyme/GNAT superfamily N-acetyltransferase